MLEPLDDLMGQLVDNSCFEAARSKKGVVTVGRGGSREASTVFWKTVKDSFVTTFTF